MARTKSTSSVMKKEVMKEKKKLKKEKKFKEEVFDPTEVGIWICPKERGKSTAPG